MYVLWTKWCGQKENDFTCRTKQKATPIGSLSMTFKNERNNRIQRKLCSFGYRFNRLNNKSAALFNTLSDSFNRLSEFSK
ncbi:hypothetical protein PMEGAS70_25670 [Priestia megaterium]